MVTVKNNSVIDLMISALFNSCTDVFGDQEAAFI